MVETGIILRIKNEEKWLKECLTRIFNQTYKNFEVIIVDSGSTDRSLEIARKFPVKIFSIKPEEFTYPYALNFGCQKSQAEKYFVILSAHSLPISNKWLEDGIRNFEIYKDKKVLGVYGWMKTLPDASIWERIYFNFFAWTILRPFLRNVKIIRSARTGVMGFTNAIVRRDLWEKYEFNEKFGLGGEDMDWATHWFSEGYVAIRDEKFSVKHSHNLGLIDFLRQWKYWYSLDKPQKFGKLYHRK